MRKEREIKVFSEMEGLYGRRRYMERVRKFGKCKELSRRIQEGDKRRKSMMSRKEKKKAENSRDRIESRGRRI